MSSNDKICTQCGHSGRAKKHTKGSIFIELIAWCCFFIPGIIYSIWRLTTKYLACSACGSRDIIPTESPRGQKLAREFGTAQS